MSSCWMMRLTDKYMAGHLPDALSIPGTDLRLASQSFPRTGKSWPIAACLIVCLQMRPSPCCVPTETAHAASNKGFRTGGLLGCQSRAEKENTDEDDRCRDIEKHGWKRGRPVTLLDICPMHERVESSIPGSIHINAYDALKANDPKALANVEFPSDIPVVTVCAAGKTSLVARQQLQARGIQALSLEGGMKAWSLAWNIAEAPGPRAPCASSGTTHRERLSLIIGDGKTAVVIDASLDLQAYLDLAHDYGWQIKLRFRRDIHADHPSRSRQLAQMSGAMLYSQSKPARSFPFTLIRDGDTLEVADCPC